MARHADPDLPLRRRGQILDAARECFRHRGFRQTTIEDICAEARVSPGALYRYFPSKADIVSAIALDARNEALALLDRLSDAEGLVNGLADLANALFTALDGVGDPALLADIWAEAARDPALARAIRERDRMAIARVAAAIERAQAAGAVYPVLPPSEAAETLLATLEGFAVRRVLDPGEPATPLTRRFRALALTILKPKR